MIGMMAHVTAMDTVTLVAVFALGWLLGMLVTAGWLRKSAPPRA